MARRMEYGRGLGTLTAPYYIFNQSASFQLHSTTQAFKIHGASHFSASLGIVLAQAGLLFLISHSLATGTAQHRKLKPVSHIFFIHLLMNT